MWFILWFGILIASTNCALDIPLCRDGGEPVCARDGLEYIYFENECKLNVFSFKQLFAGKPRLTRVALEDCFANCVAIICPAVYQPVCVQPLFGGQARTVSNICLVNQLICDSRKPWVVKAYGPCSTPSAPTYTTAESSYPTSTADLRNPSPSDYEATQVHGRAPETALYTPSASGPSEYHAPVPVAYVPAPAPTPSADPAPSPTGDYPAPVASSDDTTSASSSYTAPSPALKHGTESSSEYAQPPAPASYHIPSSASYSAYAPAQGESPIPKSAYYPGTADSADHAAAPSPAHEQESESESAYYPAPAPTADAVSTPVSYVEAAPAPYTCPTMLVDPLAEQTSPGYANAVPSAYPISASGHTTASDQEPVSTPHIYSALAPVESPPVAYPNTDEASDQYQVASPASHSYLSQDSQSNPGTYSVREQSNVAGSNAYLASGQDPAPFSYPATEYASASPPAPVPSSPYYAVPALAAVSSPGSYTVQTETTYQPKEIADSYINSAQGISSDSTKDQEPAPTPSPCTASAHDTAPASTYVSSNSHPATSSSPPQDYASAPVVGSYPASESASVPSPVLNAAPAPAPEYIPAPAVDSHSPSAPVSVSSRAHDYVSTLVAAPATTSCESASTTYPNAMDDVIPPSEPYPHKALSAYEEPAPISPPSGPAISPAPESGSDSCTVSAPASVSYPTSSQYSPPKEPTTEEDNSAPPPSTPHQYPTRNYLQQAAYSPSLPSVLTTTYSIVPVAQLYAILRSLEYNIPAIGGTPQYIAAENLPDFAKWTDCKSLHQLTQEGYRSGSQAAFYYQPTYTYIEYHRSKSSYK